MHSPSDFRELAAACYTPLTVCRKTSTVGTTARKAFTALPTVRSKCTRDLWCAVGTYIGNELDGTGKHHDRPVLVIRPFNAETFFGIALVVTNAPGAITFRSERSRTVWRL